MYAFGDDEDPRDDTAGVMEDLLGTFIQDLVRPLPVLGCHNLVSDSQLQCTLPSLPAAHPNANRQNRGVPFSHIQSRLAAHPMSLPLLERFEELVLLQKELKVMRAGLSTGKDPSRDLAQFDSMIDDDVSQTLALVALIPS